jgi:hypothetical protein
VKTSTTKFFSSDFFPPVKQAKEKEVSSINSAREKGKIRRKVKKIPFKCSNHHPEFPAE